MPAVKRIQLFQPVGGHLKGRPLCKLKQKASCIICGVFRPNHLNLWTALCGPVTRRIANGAADPSNLQAECQEVDAPQDRSAAGVRVPVDLGAPYTADNDDGHRDDDDDEADARRMCFTGRGGGWGHSCTRCICFLLPLRWPKLFPFSSAGSIAVALLMAVSCQADTECSSSKTTAIPLFWVSAARRKAADVKCRTGPLRSPLNIFFFHCKPLIRFQR